MTEERRRLLERLLSHVPPGEVGRFLVIGIWNTFAGYVIYALLNYLLSQRFPSYGYLIAGLLASIINITLAFLGYKWFVFRTSGNYLREWLGTLSVYGIGIAVGFLLLPITVTILRELLGLSHDTATYVGAFILTMINAVWSFLGNKKFSFKTKPSASDR